MLAYDDDVTCRLKWQASAHAGVRLRKGASYHYVMPIRCRRRSIRFLGQTDSDADRLLLCCSDNSCSVAAAACGTAP